MFFTGGCHLQSNLCGIILFVFVLTAGDNLIGCNMQYESLRSHILRNYSRKAKMFTEINVTLLFDAQHIIKMDEKYGILTIKGQFMMKWLDENLLWNPHDFADFKVITVTAADIWHPEIYEVFNSNNNWSGIAPILVHHTGMLKWYPTSTFDAPCTIDIKLYPFDVQKCVLQFGSRATFGSAAVLQIFNLPLNAMERRKGGEWELLSVVHTKANNQKFSSPLPLILAEIIIHRATSSSIYWHSFILPQVACCLITIAEFWLGISDLHRTVIACCNMLAFFAMFLPLLLTTPMSNGTPIIVTGSAVFTCLSILFLLETIACSVITRSTMPPPKCLVNLARRYGTQNSCFKKISSSQNCHRNYSMRSNASSDHGFTSFSDKVPTPDDWYLISVALDRLIFWVYCLTYLITFSIMLFI